MIPGIPYALGGIPDPPDPRDLVAHPVAFPEALPSAVDLRGRLGAVRSQGQLGSCSAHAGCALLEALYATQRAPAARSPLFTYYNARALRGTIDEDSGTTLREVLAGIARWGACHESRWRYDPARFTRRPTDACYREAEPACGGWYVRVAGLAGARTALAQGFPVAATIGVYDSLVAPDTARTGTVGLPAAGERLVGTHAIVLVAYDDAAETVVFRNSWGASWGARGHGTLPYTFVESASLTSDLWTLRKTPPPGTPWDPRAPAGALA